MNAVTPIGTQKPAARKNDGAVLTQRFVALAFCRADLLFELDGTQHIVFSAGTTTEIFGRSASELFGKPFTDLLNDADRQLVSDLLMASGKDARIDDIPVRIPLRGGTDCNAVSSGYRVPDFNHNFFLAVKIQPRRTSPSGPAIATQNPVRSTNRLSPTSPATVSVPCLHQAQPLR